MDSNIKLKVCGMRDEQNIKDLLQLSPDFMGFIFYDRSPRNVGNLLNEIQLQSFPGNVKKVGVFVNATVDFIKEKKEKYGLDYIQLHGNESAEFCHQLSTINYQLIKAFSIDDSFNFQSIKEYDSSCEYFLFDTKGKNPGGNGLKFNWEILKTNHINKPFFLSGGIELEDVPQLSTINYQLSTLYALDVNSKFEISPGIKDINKIKKLKDALYGNIDSK